MKITTNTLYTLQLKQGEFSLLMAALYSAKMGEKIDDEPTLKNFASLYADIESKRRTHETR